MPEPNYDQHPDPLVGLQAERFRTESAMVLVDAGDAQVVILAGGRGRVARMGSPLAPVSLLEGPAAVILLEGEGLQIRLGRGAAVMRRYWRTHSSNDWAWGRAAASWETWV